MAGPHYARSIGFLVYLGVPLYYGMENDSTEQEKSCSIEMLSPYRGGGSAGKIVSTQRAMARRRASCQASATICRPIGSPSARPAGIVRAGSPISDQGAWKVRSPVVSRDGARFETVGRRRQ